MKTNHSLILGILLWLWVGSCASNIREVNFNIARPLRVAVLPFEDISSGDTYLSKPFAVGVDYVPLIGGDDVQAPGGLMREKFIANLQSTNLDPVLTSLVDHALLQNQLYDAAKLKTMNLSLLEDLLDVDAVIFGTVTEWGRSYYGLESAVTVGLRVKMVDVSNNQTLWEAHYTQTERRGLSKIPTGYVSAGLEPLRGLSSTLFIELSNDVCRSVVDTIRPEKQGEFQEISLPEIANTVCQYDPTKKELLVLAIGEAGALGFFSVGKQLKDIPMTEVSPGQYAGRYTLLEGAFKDQDIFVSLVNSLGQRSTVLLSVHLSSSLDSEEVSLLLHQKNK